MRNNTHRSLATSSFTPLIALLLIAALGLFSTGCEEAGDDPESSQWRTALATFDSGDTQLFSFSYTSAPPEGSLFHMMVLDPQDVNGLGNEAGAACSLFGPNNPQPNNPDFWYLKVTLSSTTPGDYTIVQNIDERAPSQASVRLVHILDWERKEAVFDAVGGTVTLNEAPQNLDDWRADMSLRAVVDAEFPTAPLREVSCNSGGATDGSESYSTCTCEDMNGRQSTCDSEDGISGCCYVAGGERFNYHLELAATPCADMCRATSPQLMSHCEALQ